MPNDTKISIEGPIGMFPNNKENIRDQIENAEGPITLDIASLGGDLYDALAIYDKLNRHEGKVKVVYSGVAASAATIIGSAADKTVAYDSTAILVHQVSSMVDILGLLNEQQIDEVINELESIKKDNKKFDALIAQIYSRKAGRTGKKMLELMTQDEWMTAQEAKKEGIIDVVKNATKASKQKKRAMVAEVNDRDDMPSINSKKSESQNSKLMDTLEKLNNTIKGLADTFKSAKEETDDEDVLAQIEQKEEEVEEKFNSQIEDLKEDYAQRLTPENEEHEDRVAELEAEVEELQEKVAKYESTKEQTPKDGDPSPTKEPGEDSPFKEARENAAKLLPGKKKGEVRDSLKTAMNKV